MQSRERTNDMVVLEDESMATDRRFSSNTERVSNRPDLEERIVAVFSAHSRDEMIRRLQSADIAYGRLSDLDDLIAHPQRRLVTVQSGSDEIEMLAPGAIVRGEKTTFGPVPDLGADDERLRAEFAAHDG